MVFRVIGELLSFVLCYLLPAYSSYKALRTGSRKAVIKLLMYWTVLSVFKGGEYFSDLFLGWYATDICWLALHNKTLPLYTPLKLVFILWLTLPQTKGYVHVYRSVIHNQFLRHEAEIDRLLLQTEAAVWAYALRLQLKAIELGKRLLEASVNHVRQLLLDQMRNPGAFLGELAAQVLVAAGQDETGRRALTAGDGLSANTALAPVKAPTEATSAHATTALPATTSAAAASAAAPALAGTGRSKHLPFAADSNDSIIFLASSPLPAATPGMPVPASLHVASPESERDLDFASPTMRRALSDRSSSAESSPGSLGREVQQLLSTPDGALVDDQLDADGDNDDLYEDADGSDENVAPAPAKPMAMTAHEKAHARFRGRRRALGGMPNAAPITRSPLSFGPSLAFAPEPHEPDVCDPPFTEQDLADDTSAGLAAPVVAAASNITTRARKPATTAPAKRPSPPRAFGTTRVVGKDDKGALIVAKRISSGRLVMPLSPHAAARKPAAPLAPVSLNSSRPVAL